MDKLKIAVADDNKQLVETLSRMILKDADLELVGTAFDGEELLPVIQNQTPDIVVLDLIMPRLDGISVMEKVNYDSAFQKKPAFLIISGVHNESITSEVFSLGAEYFILKPFDFSMLLHRIRQIGRKLQTKYSETLPGLPAQLREEVLGYQGESLEATVTRALHDIGVPAHIRGYQYLRDAIMLTVMDLNMLNSVTKQLYPAIARKYDTVPTRVERAIRHALELCYAREKKEMLQNFLGYTVNTGSGKPTNAEFIALVSDKIRIEQNHWHTDSPQIEPHTSE